MDLDAIEKRAAKYAEHTGTLRCCNAHDTADDVPALVARVRELEEENQKLRALVADLADDGTCWYDHHGYCQEHGWFATDPKCPHARARQITQEEA